MREFNSTFIPHPPFCILWNSIPKNKKIALEIGAGKGHFSIEFSDSNKDWFLIALERTEEKAEAFKKLFVKSKCTLDNLFYVRADGVNVVTHLVLEKSLDKIFLLYPNPYVKSKQANLRWHNMPFFKELIQRLKINGEIEFRTNLKWYADECEDRLLSFKTLKLKKREILDSDFKAQTAFEKKYLERGETCHRLIYLLQEN